jgi:cell shape-determining protein MreC
MSETRSGWLVIGLIGALLLLGLALGQLGYLGPVRNLSRALLAPFQAGLMGVGTDANDLVRSARDLRNAQLQAETDRLSVENARLTEVERENERLRQLLNFTRSNPWYDCRAAAVVGQKIGEDTSNLLFSIFIDVGARDGVAVDMPVITDAGQQPIFTGGYLTFEPGHLPASLLQDHLGTAHTRL